MAAASIVLVMASTGTALMAGLFYTFTCLVSLGLARLRDAEYIAAMQSINLAVRNRLFFIGFFGTPLLLSVATAMHAHGSGSRFLFLLAASAAYLIGAFGVTVARNLPLNDKLARFDVSMASDKEIAAHRAAFGGPWNAWNAVRTVASTMAVVFVALACLS